MQVATPTPAPASDDCNPSTSQRCIDACGSPYARSSPSSASPRRLRRSLRLSGASMLSPQQALNKENASPLNQMSTSAKVLEIASSEQDRAGSPRLGSELSSSPARKSSPLRSRSSPTRFASPLRRSRTLQSDDVVLTSDESDDSTLVFFGKPSSAEKKKRVHYEQRVLEKRLKHKDSLDLARRRPISFNPDDTMLIDDQSAFGWSWNKATPTPFRSRMAVISPLATSLPAQESPTVNKSTARDELPSSPTMPSHDNDTTELPATPNASKMEPSEPLDSTHISPESQQPRASPNPLHLPAPAETTAEVKGQNRQSPSKSGVDPDINPFAEAQSKPAEDSGPKSPSKQRPESPRRNQSPVRSVESLIGATMAHNKELHSPVRSPRRSPRLSLRALQLSTSPAKSGPNGLFFGPTTPFQEPMAAQQATPNLQSTPSQPPRVVQPIPPSTGLSRFACLQNIIPVSRAPETPVNRALSTRLTQHEALPSPFISSGMFEAASIRTPSGKNIGLDFGTPSPTWPLRSPNLAKRSQSPGKRIPISDDPRGLPGDQTSSRSGGTAAPATPSVRFAEPNSHDTPSKYRAVRTPSPAKIQPLPDVARSADDIASQSELLSSPLRGSADAASKLLSTPPLATPDAKAETPGPIFRQTARRVPIHQHEAEFGVKVSPEKPSYSPRKHYANSSARTNDFGARPERIPARRVPVQPAPAARQNTTKQGEMQAPSAARIASVASKSSRTVSVSASRFGGQSTSLPAAALSRAVSAASAPAASALTTRVASSAQSANRAVSSSQASASVASKASRLQRPGPTVFGAKSTSPSKQTRSLTGLPKPKLNAGTATATAGSGPGSRLPRPATLGPANSTARPTSRPVPMAIARLAPAQKSLKRVAASSTNLKGITALPARDNTADVELAPEAPAATLHAVVGEGSPQSSHGSDDGEQASGQQPEVLAEHSEHMPHMPSTLRASVAPSAANTPSVESDVTVPSDGLDSTLQFKTSRLSSRATEAPPARSSSPIVTAPPARPVTSARPAPAVKVYDPEQQRLRCLAMQEKARNRAPKASSSSSVPPSSDVEESPSSEASAGRDSPQTGTDELAVSSAPSAIGLNGAASVGGALTLKQNETVEGASTPAAPSSGAQGPIGSAAAVGTGTTLPATSTTTSTGRPLRSTRSAARTLTPSATRVPPSRGRALSLNDIIAARKIDVPLSLTDQLKLADTVNKKHNEKTLARYKITKVQRPYERPPSPERHDHEPEACTISDDFSHHRQGKGDLAPYSTPTKNSTSSTNGHCNNRKTVRWYRPLFVGKGAQYGLHPSEAKPALKPVSYELDRMGNKVATGLSPKLSKGQSIVIYRNYFKGEPEPADD